MSRSDARELSAPRQYSFMLIALGIATALRVALDPLLGDHLPYVTFFVAVALVAWRTSLAPSIVMLFAGWWISHFLFTSPRYAWVPNLGSAQLVTSMLAYFAVGAVSIVVSEAMRRARWRSEQSSELLRVTLSSIGEGIVTTDKNGKITSLNRTAENLTGWTNAEVRNRALANVVRIVNETTRIKTEDAITEALREGRIVPLDRESVLIAKEGSEYLIDGSAAPIRAPNGTVLGAVLVFRDLSQQRRLDRAVAQSDAHSKAILETALDCVITMDGEGKIVEFNPASEKVFGYRRGDVLGKEMGEVLVPRSLRESHRAGLKRYVATGEARVLNQRLELTAMRADGTEFPVELAITRIPGTQTLFTGYLRDITDRKLAEERQRLLTNELNHRVKNVFATVQAIAHQTARATPDPNEFFSAFSDRLVSMSRVHDILTKHAWKPTDAGELTAASLAPYLAAIEIDGGSVELGADEAVSVSLVLHELGTNAAKYGALSRPGGRISVRWCVEGEPKQRVMMWRERGGPSVTQPTRRGFGSQLIERVASQLSGTVLLSYDSAGVTCELRFPHDGASSGPQSEAN